MLAPRQHQRVNDALGRNRRLGRALQLSIEKSNVKAVRHNTVVRFTRLALACSSFALADSAGTSTALKSRISSANASFAQARRATPRDRTAATEGDPDKNVTLSRSDNYLAT
jgi:hypothetical protein